MERNQLVKVAIYARKSTESEDRQVLSIDSQIKELSDWAAKSGIQIAKIYRESKSAKEPGRPVFNEVLRDVHRGTISEVVCWKLDRLARNPVDGGAVIWAIEEGKLRKVHTPQKTYLDTGNDKFWMQLEFGMASKFIYDLRDNTKRGLRAKYQQGWYPARAPVGYLNDVRTHTIVKDPDRFDIVRRMWDYFLTGAYTPSQIQELAEHKWCLRTRQTKRQGGRPLTISAVYRTLHNPFYSGRLAQNGETFQGAHEPMVTVAEFERVQELLGGAHKPRPSRRSFAFTGLIRCGECGCAVTASHTINRHGTHYEYYHCTKRKKNRKCSQPAIRREDLEQQFAAFLGCLTIPRAYCEFALRMVQHTFEEESEKDQQSTKSMKTRHEEIKRELSQLLQLKLRELVTEEEFVQQKRELASEQSRIAELLFDADGQFARALEQAETIINLSAGLYEKFNEGDNQAKRELVIATCCNPIILHKKLHIQARKPFSLIEKRMLGLRREILDLQPAEIREAKPKRDVPRAAILVMGG